MGGEVRMNTEELIYSFAGAIRSRQIIIVKFRTKTSNQILLRKCAPLDIAPSKRSKNKIFKFHLWDLESGKTNHILSLEPSQIIEWEITDEQFEPAKIVTWNVASAPWCVKRDWSTLS